MRRTIVTAATGLLLGFIFYVKSSVKYSNHWLVSIHYIEKGATHPHQQPPLYNVINQNQLYGFEFILSDHYIDFWSLECSGEYLYERPTIPTFFLLCDSYYLREFNMSKTSFPCILSIFMDVMPESHIKVILQVQI